MIGGSTAALAVTLSGPAPTGGATVTLTSSNVILPLPASITIPAGERAAKLAVTVKAGNSAAGPNTATSVTVTASYGGISKSVTVLIPPVATPPTPGTVTLLALEVSPTVPAGSIAGLAVILSGPAPSGGATVTLTSSNAAFPLPPSITIPAGERAAKLLVQTKAAPAANSTIGVTSVTVTAAYNGVSKSALVTITPATPMPMPTSNVLYALEVSATVPGGGLAKVAVTLAGPAPAAGATVTLTSSNPTVFPLPATVVVRSGEKSALFTVQTTAVNAATAVTVTAASGGVSKSASVTVTPPSVPATSAAPALVAISATTPVVGGKIALVTVSLNAPAPATGLAVALASTNRAFPVPASLTVKPGEKGGTVSVETTPVTAPTPVTLTATYGGVVKSVIVIVNP